MENKSKFMLRAIELSIQSAKTSGGPFGCVIVKNNKIIADDKRIVSVLKHYFENITIEDDKYLLGWICKLWNKEGKKVFTITIKSMQILNKMTLNMLI